MIWCELTGMDYSSRDVGKTSMDKCVVSVDKIYSIYRGETAVLKYVIGIDKIKHVCYNG